MKLISNFTMHGYISCVAYKSEFSEVAKQPCHGSTTPTFLENENEKYDVNWELGGMRYKWNLFLSKLKFKWKYRN